MPNIPQISYAALEAYRARTFHLAPALRLASEADALAFINASGFALLWIAGEEFPLPTLSAAYSPSLAGWGWWDWKQTLPNKKACFYAKILRHKGTFLSWDYFPYFYSVYASPLSIEEEWQAGTLDRTQKRLLDILSEQGPLMTKELRLAYGSPSKANTRLVKAALEVLQRSFRICPAGGDTEGWSHHRWDLVDRWVPAKYLRKARTLDPIKSGAAIIAQFLRLAGVSNVPELTWLFGWEKATAQQFLAAVPNLVQVKLADEPEPVVTLKAVLKEIG